MMVIGVRRKFPLVCSVRASIHRLEHRVLSSMPSVWRPSVSCCCWDRIGTQPHAPSATRTVPCVHFFSSSSSLLWSLKPRTDRSHVKDPCHLPPAFWCDVTWLAFSTYCYGRVASFFYFFIFACDRKYFEKRSQNKSNNAMQYLIQWRQLRTSCSAH